MAIRCVTETKMASGDLFILFLVASLFSIDLTNNKQQNWLSLKKNWHLSNWSANDCLQVIVFINNRSTNSHTRWWCLQLSRLSTWKSKTQRYSIYHHRRITEAQNLHMWEAETCDCLYIFVFKKYELISCQNSWKLIFHQSSIHQYHCLSTICHPTRLYFWCLYVKTNGHFFQICTNNMNPVWRNATYYQCTNINSKYWSYAKAYIPRLLCQ